jgi:hypothetical protein
MTNTAHEPLRNGAIRVSLAHRTFRVTRWLLALSLLATLFIGLIRYPLERTSVDPTAPHQESDYVLVRGLPHFFYVSDARVAHPPASSTLIQHFALDWLTFFIIFAVPVFGIECIRIVAFFAAYFVRSRLPQ